MCEDQDAAGVGVCDWWVSYELTGEDCVIRRGILCAAAIESFDLAPGAFYVGVPWVKISIRIYSMITRE